MSRAMSSSASSGASARARLADLDVGRRLGHARWGGERADVVERIVGRERLAERGRVEGAAQKLCQLGAREPTRLEGETTQAFADPAHNLLEHLGPGEGAVRAAP